MTWHGWRMLWCSGITVWIAMRGTSASYSWARALLPLQRPCKHLCTSAQASCDFLLLPKLSAGCGLLQSLPESSHAQPCCSGLQPKQCFPAAMRAVPAPCTRQQHQADISHSAAAATCILSLLGSQPAMQPAIHAACVEPVRGAGHCSEGAENLPGRSSGPGHRSCGEAVPAREPSRPWRPLQHSPGVHHRLCQQHHSGKHSSCPKAGGAPSTSQT